MWFNLYGLDIETDTSPLTQEELDAGYTHRGLDPAITKIINLALSDSSGVTVLDGEEKDILLGLDNWLKSREPGLLVTWNGSVFDLPFIYDRAKRLNINIGLHLSADPLIVPKYEPTPGYSGGFTATWDSLSNQVSHAHLDVAYLYKKYAEEAGIPWSLKPVAKELGLNPIKVDAANVHLLTREEQNEYVASDARVTRELAFKRLIG